jgi:hypothetical protein
LYFGDGLTGDYSVNAVTMNNAQTEIAFGGKAYESSSLVDVPFVGIYTISTGAIKWL